MFLSEKKIDVSHDSIIVIMAVYLGYLLNLPIYIRRYEVFSSTLGKQIALYNTFIESLIIFSSIVLFLFIVSVGGRFVFRIITSLILLISVIAVYYMIFYNVVIGYGVISAVFSTDIDMSKEIVGVNTIVWAVLLGVLPIIGMNKIFRIEPSIYEQVRNKKNILRLIVVFMLCCMIIMFSIDYFKGIRNESRKIENRDMPNQGSIAFYSYVPSNWIVGSVVFISNMFEELSRKNNMFDPAKHFIYTPKESIDDTFLVFVIGETARYDHMGLFGYERETNEFLQREKNLVAIKGISSDTSTKLSLRTMFVREGGVEQHSMLPKEENVFSVLKSLGFTSELFAMQSEVWFYNSLKCDSYKFREDIAAEKDNVGKPIDDMLLIPQLERSINSHANGKHIVILHTKGQHYLYTNRYPRSFAKFVPECMDNDAYCDKQKLINSYDNSISYTDYFLSKVIKTLKNHKALIFYTSDHGESIDDNSHLHATPKEIAPPEQRKVPIVIWASDKFLSVPENQASFERLKKHQGEVRRHEELYDSILGCLGYTSPNNGISSKNNWCQ